MRLMLDRKCNINKTNTSVEQTVKIKENSKTSSKSRITHDQFLSKASKPSAISPYPRNSTDIALNKQSTLAPEESARASYDYFR